jgi:hypothetical protein
MVTAGLIPAANCLMKKETPSSSRYRSRLTPDSKV